MREEETRTSVKSPRLDRQKLARLLSDQGMYDHAAAFLTSKLHYDIPGAELVRLVLGKDKRPSSRRVIYELRFHEFGVSEQAVVGRIDERVFLRHLRNNYDHCLHQLRMEQETCDWQLVAGLVEPLNLRRSFAVPAEESQASFNHLEMIAARAEQGVKPGQGLNQSIRHVEAPDYRCQVKLVFADVARADLQDPNLKHGTVPGPMSRYADSRRLQHLTQGQRETRRTCEQLVRVFWGLPEPESDLFRGVAPPPTRDEFDDLLDDEQAERDEGAEGGEDASEDELDIDDPRVQRAIARMLAKKKETAKKKRESPVQTAKESPVSPRKQPTPAPKRQSRAKNAPKSVSAPALQPETREKGPVVDIPEVNREDGGVNAAEIERLWREGTPVREIARAVDAEYSDVTKAIARLRALDNAQEA